MRVLHIMSGYGGGISSFIRNKAQEMNMHDIVFDVVTYDQCADSFVEAIRSTGGDVYMLVNPKQEGWTQFYQSLTRVLKAHRYDAIHCHISGCRAIPYACVCRLHGIKRFYIHAHFTLDAARLSWRNKFDQWVNRRVSQAYLGCSDDAVKSIYGCNIPLEKAMIIPNSIDMSMYAQAEQARSLLRNSVRQQYQISPDTVVVGHIGRLTPIKNHAHTLALANLAKSQNKNMCFLLVGAGELEAELKRQVVEQNLEEYVILAGRVEPIAELYPSLDVLVLPSFREGLPTVVIESQAMGVPVLVSSTITQEVDLGLSLVKTLDLNEALDWLNTIEEVVKVPVPSFEQRHEIMETCNFTNLSSARLYVAFLKGEIQHYRIARRR